MEWCQLPGQRGREDLGEKGDLKMSDPRSGDGMEAMALTKDSTGVGWAMRKDHPRCYIDGSDISARSTRKGDSLAGRCIHCTGMNEHHHHHQKLYTRLYLHPLWIQPSNISNPCFIPHDVVPVQHSQNPNHAPTFPPPPPPSHISHPTNIAPRLFLSPLSTHHLPFLSSIGPS